MATVEQQERKTKQQEAKTEQQEWNNLMSHKLSIAKRKQRKAHIVKRTANDEYKQRKKQLA